MGWAAACFPLAGAGVGGLVAGLGVLLDPWLPPPILSALLLASLLAITGALHLDGFMDGFDGLFGGRSQERRLEIMRDSRVGSYGIAAAVSLLLAEYGSLISLPPNWRAAGLIAAVAVSRWTMVFVLWYFPSASSKGLAASLKPEIRWLHLLVATAIAFAIAIACFDWEGTILIGVAFVIASLGGRLATGRLGGISGDICGGLGQLVEACTLIASVVMAG